MADDLGEEWWISDPCTDPKDQKDDDDDDDEKEHDKGDLETTPKKKKVVKRKHEEEEDKVNEEQPTKKKKKVKRKKISDVLAKSKPRPAKYIDLITSMTRHYTHNLSVVELDELKLSKTHFVPSHDLVIPQEEYLKSVMPKWANQVECLTEPQGAPLLLVVCSAATRAVDFIRELKKFHGEKCKVAKLFAKHMKVNEQVKFLKKNVIHIGVGTPNRIAALLQQDALHLDKVSLVLFDWSWRDAKLRRLFDIPEMRDDLFPLLHKHLIPHIKQGTSKFSLL